MARKIRLKFSLGDASSEIVKCIDRDQKCLLRVLDTITEVVCSIADDPKAPGAWEKVCHDLVGAYYGAAHDLKNVLKIEPLSGRKRRRA